MVLLFLGPSGSGKDTQAEILAEKYGYQIISTGQMFRDSQETPEGKEAEQYTKEGKWVPDELTYKMLENYLQGKDLTNVIFTGAVRRVSQIPLLDQTLSKLSTKLDKVVYFALSDEEVIKRLSGRRYSPSGKMYHVQFKPPKVEGIDDETGEALFQREDDQPEAIASRLAEGHKFNDEILAEYRRRGELIEIDAARSIDEIAADVLAKLNLT